MKRFTLAVVFGLLTSFMGTGIVQAQSGATAPATTHRVGLIDMAHIFKNYKKFEVLREDLKAEVQKSELEAKAMAQTIKKMQLQMKDVNEGSPQYIQMESGLAKKVSEFETFRKVTQRDFLRKESQIYRTIYMEVTDSVEKYASYYKYTLILRFNRGELDESTAPAEIIQKMNRVVVYHRAEEDITDAVLDYLNRKYSPATPVQQTSGSASPRN